MSTKVFDLKFPFEYKGASFVEFKARRPKVRDLRDFIKNADKDGVDAMAKALGNLCEVDDKVMQEVDLEDFGPMKAWFEDFLKPMLGDSND